MSQPTAQEEAENKMAIEQWKIKRLIKSLDNSKGNGTSMITLIIPPNDDINRYKKMLTDEASTASNIKSRVNRQSVCGAITSTQQKLKQYARIPDNGLVLFCGEVMLADDSNSSSANAKVKKVCIALDNMHKPINTSLYMCDNHFHTEDLQCLLQNEDKFGFLVMDGHGSLYGTVCGNAREVLHKFSVELPKKHGRGGQSALRFARLRLEKRHNYKRKVGEIAVQMFITNDRPNVRGLILAGSAEFKNDLLSAAGDLFDPRLADIVIKVVDVSYGGENGFNQAIELSQDALANVRFVAERKLICRYLEEIAMDTGKICFGVKDTLLALDLAAVETLIVWENLDVQRYELRHPNSGETTIVMKTSIQIETSKEFLRCVEDNVDYEVVEVQPFSEWIVANFTKYGCKLEFITDKSQEGNQFVKGFGGIGGLLRYRVDFNEMEGECEEYEDDESDDEWI